MKSLKDRGSRSDPVLVTGGAGFIGSNLCWSLLSRGEPVIIYDNLSRPGVESNLQWLQETYGGSIEFHRGDIRDFRSLLPLVRRSRLVYHLAAQVAVTTSIVDPLADFDANLRGTVNLLEAIRAADTRPPLIFTSTNKVYGGLDDIKLKKNGARYEPADVKLTHGIREDRPLQFHSPYGCSKGAADQYVLDYGRIYGLETVVFRMSCIYGPRQFGTEDQGWIAHFLIRCLRNEPVVIYGDGMQIRDVLYIDDLVEALQLAGDSMDAIRGEAFNVGGGAANTVSILELLQMIHDLHGELPSAYLQGWRPGDQKFYVSDFTKFYSATGWRPAVSVHEGLKSLYFWLRNFHSDRPCREAGRL